MNGARTLLATATAAAVVASGAGSVAAPGGVAFREIDHGTRPGSGERELLRGRVLRSESGAARVLRGWKLDGAVAAAKTVDFERRSVIVALDATRPSTGFRLRVERVDVRNRRAIVTATVRRSGGIDGQALSRPYALVSVARGSLARATRGAVVRLRG